MDCKASGFDAFDRFSAGYPVGDRDSEHKSKL